MAANTYQNFLSHFIVFFCKADFRSVNLTSEAIFSMRVTSSAKAFFEVVDVLIEGFS